MNFTDLLNDERFTQFEERLSARLGLERRTGNSTGRELLRKQIEDSRYDLAQIAERVLNRSSHFDRFAPAWYCDASGIDYGEEFDPDEGDQQDGKRKGELKGISEGFTISYLLLFLYGTEAPDDLEAWIRKRRIPAAKKVARDVRRIIGATAKSAESGPGE